MLIKTAYIIDNLVKRVEEFKLAEITVKYEEGLIESLRELDFEIDYNRARPPKKIEIVLADSGRGNIGNWYFNSDLCKWYKITLLY